VFADKFKKILFFYLDITFFLAVFIANFVLFSCNKPKLKDVEALTSEEVFPIETAKDIEYIFSDSAIVKAKLIAPLMKKYATDDHDDYLELSEGLHVTFFNEFKEPSSFLRADHGIQYINRKIIEVTGNVVVVNTRHDTLNSEHLIWDEKNDKVFSHKFVRVRTEDEIIHSEGFETDLGFTQYKFKNIKGIISLREDE